MNLFLVSIFSFNPFTDAAITCGSTVSYCAPSTASGSISWTSMSLRKTSSARTTAGARMPDPRVMRVGTGTMSRRDGEAVVRALLCRLVVQLFLFRSRRKIWCCWRKETQAKICSAALLLKFIPLPYHLVLPLVLQVSLAVFLACFVFFSRYQHRQVNAACILHSVVLHPRPCGKGGWYTPVIFFSEMAVEPLGGSRWNFA